MTRILVNSKGDFANVLGLLETEDEFAFDTETDGLNPYRGNRIVGVSLYFPGFDTGYYLPFRHIGYDNLSDNDRVVFGRTLFSNKEACVATWNGKFDFHMAGVEGWGAPERVAEGMIALQLLDENRKHVGKNYKLKDVADEFLGAGASMDEAELIKKYGKEVKSGMGKVDPVDMMPYAVSDVELTWKLIQFFLPHLDRWNQRELFESRNEFLLKVLFRMEQNGFRLDLDEIDSQIERSGTDAAKIKEEFLYRANERGIYGEFNPNSPKQLLNFFAKNGVGITSTNAATMTALADAGNEDAKLVQDWKHATGAVSKFFEPYKEMVGFDGYLHPSFNPIGTVSGRLSCDSPNLQQVPRKGDEAKLGLKANVKKVFIASPGYKIVQMDYKALELRLGTYIADETTMKEMFNNGVDLHAYTGEALGIGRQSGKTANFGLLYGMGYLRAMLLFGVTPAEAVLIANGGLEFYEQFQEASKSLRMRRDEMTPEEIKEAKAVVAKWYDMFPSYLKAGQIVEGWHELYPAFRRANASYEALAKQRRNPDGSDGGRFQYVRLFNGRCRHFSVFANEDNPPYYTAYNFVVQGTGAAVTEASLIKIAREFPDNDEVRFIATVHDSVVFEVREDVIDKIVPRVAEIMVDWPQFNPKMAVDIEIGDNWKELKPYERKN